MKQCPECFKKRTQKKCSAGCRKNYTLVSMASKWPKLREEGICLICCTLYETLNELAIHYMRHNWDDVKYLGIHPLVCRKAVDQFNDSQPPRKRDQKKADKNEFKKPMDKQNFSADLNQMSHSTNNNNTNETTMNSNAS